MVRRTAPEERSNEVEPRKEELVDRAIRLAQDNKWDRALALNEELITLFGADAEDYNRLGLARERMGNLDGALAAYENALQLQPGNRIASRKAAQLRGRQSQTRHLADRFATMKEAGMAGKRRIPTNHHSIPLQAKVRIASMGRVGLVTSHLPSSQYRIYIDEHNQPIVAEGDLEVLRSRVSFVTPEEFMRELLMFKLRNPLSDVLYSYAMSRTNFEAYQFKPAIKFLQNPNGGLLLADEVGLGKTVEACIIYLELKARMHGDLPRVLVLCPASLKSKWESELRTRFGEEFKLLGRREMLQFLAEYERHGPASRLRAICSIESLRAQDVIRRIVEVDAQFDLVVIDEAHHARNPETASHDVGEVLSAHADYQLMLTATPVQLGTDDLFHLLTILNPGQFEDKETFQYQLQPTRLINQSIACLSANPPEIENARASLLQCRTFLGDNPFYGEVVELVSQLQRQGPSSIDKQQLVDVVRYLHRLNPFSLVFSRTRRREVSQGAIRAAIAVNVELQPVEQQIYAAALRFARARAKEAKGHASVLGLIQVERQIASSIGAFQDVVADYYRCQRYEAQVESTSTDLDYVAQVPKAEALQLAASLQELFAKLGSVDSKFERFYWELSRLLESSSSRKVIVYTFFRRTISYLERHLKGRGHKVLVIHGGKKPAERQWLMDRFREDPQARILLCSEVGAEGVDMQFCDTIVNYDLPWNPMRVEQRIGRIDRYGQTSDKVTIVSFFLANTIEERILKRLYDRIGVFEESIGGLEPIIGNVERDLPYELLKQELTPSQEQRRADQYIQALLNRRREQEEFERSRHELIGNETWFSQQVEDSISSGRYVSPNETRALVESYLGTRCPNCSLRRASGSEDVWMLSPDNVLIGELTALMNSRRRHTSGEEWLFLKRAKLSLNARDRYVRSGSGGLRLTFSADLAHRRPLLEFVSVWHPLVKLAYEYYNSYPPKTPEERMIVCKAPAGQGARPSTYFFFLFSITTKAMIDKHEMYGLVLTESGEVNRALSFRLLALLHSVGEDGYRNRTSMSDGMLELARESAVKEMAEVKRNKEDEARRRNAALIADRRAALSKTFEVKINRAKRRLESATDARIVRMHRGEINNLNSKLNTMLAELDAKERVLVTYELVARGLIIADATT